jgi:outer membrane protein assembly factor BamB
MGIRISLISVCTIILSLMLGASSEIAGADVSELRLLKVQNGQPVELAVSDDTFANRKAALAEHWQEQYPDFDPEDPVCKALVWFSACWTPPKANAPGRHVLSAKYHDIGVENFNACQELCARAASLELPAGFKQAWRARWAKELIMWRLPSSASLEFARINVPSGGTIVSPKSGSEFSEAVAKAYPSFGTLTPEDKQRWFEVLAHLNAGLDVDGFYTIKGKVTELAPHVSVPRPDGRTQVFRYQLESGMPIYLPPEKFVNRRASEIQPIQPEQPAQVVPAQIYDVVLPKAVGGVAPLHLHLVRRGGRIQNAWTTTPTVNNRAGRAIIGEYDPNDEPEKLELFTAGQSHLELQLSFSKGVLDLTCTGTTGDDKSPRSFKGEVKSTPRGETPLTDAPTATWPWLLGPNNSNEGPSAGEPLIENPSEARLSWISDEPIPCGRGPDTRGKAKKLPGETLSGGWAGVIVAEDSVFLWYYVPSGKHYAYGAEALAARKGEDPDDYKVNLIGADDVVHCFDAATGRTRWKRVFKESAMTWFGFNKSGPELTPCYYKGRIYCAGTLGNVYCVDAKTGATIWKNDIKQRARLLREQMRVLISAKQNYGSRSDFSSCLSAGGGVVIVNNHVHNKGGDRHYRYEKHNGIIAFDAETGAVRWRVPEIVDNAPTPWEHGGTAYFVGPGKSTISLIRAEDGKVFWSIPGSCAGRPPVVTGNIMLCRVDEKLSAYELHPSGAKALWRSNVPFPSGHMPAVHKGHVYSTIKGGGSVCLDLKTGRKVAEASAAAGMGFNIAADGRLLGHPDASHNSPNINCLRAEPQSYESLSQPWSLPLAGAYTTPIVPALVEGRLYIRLTDRLACYDLRASKAVSAREHATTKGTSTTSRHRAPPKKKVKLPKIDETPEDLGVDLDL